MQQNAATKLQLRRQQVTSRPKLNSFFSGGGVYFPPQRPPLALNQAVCIRPCVPQNSSPTDAMAVCREGATRSGVGHVTDGWVGGTDAERGSGRQCTGRGRGRLLRGGGRDCSAVVMCTARTPAELIRFHQISAACVAATARPLTPPSQPSGRTWNQQQQQQQQVMQ